MARVRIATLLSMLAFACTRQVGALDSTDSTDESESTPTGDGDSDGDGDGDDPTTAPTDTDDPTGDPGDSEDSTDSDDPIDGCSDGDSGNVPFEEYPIDHEPRSSGSGSAGGPKEPATCEVFAQDCPDGEKCVPFILYGREYNDTKCVPVTGSGMAGEPCTYGGPAEATDNCDEDTACWDINNEWMGTCTPFCRGTPNYPICPPGTACLHSNDGVIAFCVNYCNPLTQTCSAGEGCFWSGESFECLPTTEDIPLGQPCDYVNDCAKGLMCVIAASLPDCAGAACCAQICDLDCGADSCDQPGTACVALHEAGRAPPGDADIGVCLRP